MTKKLYIDNNYLTNEDNWSGIKKYLNQHPDTKLVISDWNLLEIAQHGNKKAKEKTIQFIESCSPIWLNISRTETYQYEIKKFLYIHLWDHDVRFTSFFCDTAYEALKINKKEPKDSFDLSQYVVNDMSSPNFLNLTNQRKKEDLDNHNRLNDDIGLATIEHNRDRIFRGWVYKFIPKFYPNGDLIKDKKKDKLTIFCIQNKKKLLQECKCFALEDAFFEINLSDPKRKAKESDTIDLQHLCSTSYCDFFITQDGYLYSTYNKICKKIHREPSIYKSIDELPSP